MHMGMLQFSRRAYVRDASAQLSVVQVGTYYVCQRCVSPKVECPVLHDECVTWEWGRRKRGADRPEKRRRWIGTKFEHVWFRCPVHDFATTCVLLQRAT